MNKRFELIIIIGIIIIIGGIAVGVASQIPINRIIRLQNPNYDYYCYSENSIIYDNNECYQPYCCENDDNNSNYVNQEEYYPTCKYYEQSSYNYENYRTRCH